MGAGVINAEVTVHRQPTGGNKYRFRHHQGNLNVETTSVEFGQSEMADIKDAAVNASQQTFNNACEAAVGSTWWAAQSGMYKAQLKDAIAEMP